jgi:hypothetical protein
VDNATAMYAEEDDEDMEPMPSIDDDDNTDASEVDDCTTDANTTSLARFQSVENRTRNQLREMAMYIKTSSYDVPLSAVNAAIIALGPIHRAMMELMASDLDVLRPPRVPRSEQGG